MHTVVLPSATATVTQPVHVRAGDRAQPDAVPNDWPSAVTFNPSSWRWSLGPCYKKLTTTLDAARSGARDWSDTANGIDT